MSFIVDFEPVGRRVDCEPGGSILEAAQRAGVMLNATCGGEGICGRCRVRIMAGEVSAPNPAEQQALGTAGVGEGWRLACQTWVLGNLRVHIPPDSLLTAQRTQTEGQNLPVKLEPAVSRCPDGRPALGLAVDLGTTKLAGYLIDLSSGETLASAGVMNPQIAYGEDVMARISHAMNHPEGAENLRIVVNQAIQSLADALCKQAGHGPDEIADAVMVGNTAMHHLFLGLPVRQLGLAPYVPAVSAAVDRSAADCGLRFAGGAMVHLLPNIAGFVGADHVAMLLGSGMTDLPGIILGMDIGTNTEISLLVNGSHYACSTASGPAFEGAHIRHGMRAAPGAVEKVILHAGQLKLQTIDGAAPVGLCGSGILDLVAQLRLNAIIDRRGAFIATDDPHVLKGDKGYKFMLTQEISFDRHDINEIQLAKGAMRAGINILLRKAGISETDIDTVIIAGAFGTYLDVRSGIAIGMFPNLPYERFQQVGNAAGAGARMALLSVSKRRQAVEIADRVKYVELTGEKDFSAFFARALLLE